MSRLALSERLAEPLSIEAEDGWMVVELEPGRLPHLQSLTLRGVHGARGGKFEQQVDLDVAQRTQLARALLAGTDFQAVPR